MWQKSWLWIWYIFRHFGWIGDWFTWHVLEGNRFIGVWLNFMLNFDTSAEKWIPYRIPKLKISNAQNTDKLKISNTENPDFSGLWVCRGFERSGLWVVKNMCFRDFDTMPRKVQAVTFISTPFIPLKKFT